MIALPQQRNKAVQCLSFDGVNDYVDVGNVGGTIPYSICFWVAVPNGINPENVQNAVINFNYASGSAYPQIVLGQSSARTTNATISLWHRSESLYPRTYIRDSFSPEWHQVSIAWDIENSHYQVFVDGVNCTVYPDTVFGHVQASNYAVYDLKIGRNYNGVKYAAMILSDVRIYNRALTADEVANLYKGRYVDPTGLVAHWKMNERDGNTLIDSAGNNDGTIYGATRTLSRRRI